MAIVEQNIKGEGGLGSIAGYSESNYTLLSKAFPNSPITGEGGMTDASVEKEYSKVLDETIADGYEFAGFTPGFGDAPDLTAVETGKGGLPATPFVPNVASPEDGSMNPTALPDPPNAEQVSTNTVYGPGASTTNPSITSNEIAKSTLGDYMKMAPEISNQSQYLGSSG